jgi:hypothetical protein
MSKENRSTHKPAEDDVLRKLRASLDQGLVGKAHKTLKSADEFGRNVQDIARGVGQVTAGSSWVYRNVLSPLWSVSEPAIGWAVRGYKRIWDRVVNVKDSEGEFVFSKKRAGMMILSTIFAAAALVNYGPPVAKELGWSATSAAWWAASNKEEAIVLNKSSDPVTGVYSVHGCHGWPCDSDNTIDFVIDDSLFHDIHRWATHGESFYPSLIAAAVPDVPSVCKVQEYGWRAKLVARLGHISPRLLDVQGCIQIPPGFPTGPVTMEAYNKLAAPPVPAPQQQMQAPAAMPAPSVS